MINLELWPWGVAIIVVLSMLIGWFAREIYRRFELQKKDEIIQAQEREYIKLADQHVEKNQELKRIIADLEEKLELKKNDNDIGDDPEDPIKFTSKDIRKLLLDNEDQPMSEDPYDFIAETPDEIAIDVPEQLAEEFSDDRTEKDDDCPMGEPLDDSPEEDSVLVRELKDQIDHLKIDKQKLSTVPQALYIEKNASLKKEIKGYKKKLNQSLETIDRLKIKLKKYKKKLKRRGQKNVQFVEVHEQIDFKQLKKLLKNIPTKKTRIVKKVKGKKEKPQKES